MYVYLNEGVMKNVLRCVLMKEDDAEGTHISRVQTYFRSQYSFFNSNENNLYQLLHGTYFKVRLDHDHLKILLVQHTQEKKRCSFGLHFSGSVF